MKRITLLFGTVLFVTAALWALHSKTRAVRSVGMQLRDRAGAATGELARIETEHVTVEQTLARLTAAEQARPGDTRLPVDLADWLVRGEHATIPAALVPQLRAALGFP